MNWSASEFKDLKELDSVTQLTTVSIVEDETSFKVVNKLPFSDPYPVKTPVSMLTRMYSISNTLNSTGDLVMLFPQAALYQIPTNSRYLQRFKYLRAGAKIRILLLSTSMQYGMVMVSFIPYTTSIVNWDSLEQLSQANAYLMDISQQNSLEVTLPYLAPQTYFNLADVSPMDVCWRVAIKVLSVGTVSAGTGTDIGVQVFAAYDNPQAAGYIPEPVAPIIFQAAEPSTWSRFAGIAAPAVAMGLTAASAVGNRVFSSTTNAMADAATEKIVQVTGVGPGKKVEEPAAPVKLQLAPDLNSPSATSINTELGDCQPRSFSFLPELCNYDNVVQICMIPTLVDQLILDSTDPLVVLTDQSLYHTYFSYFKRMYKYYRGSVRLMIKFVTSPLVSGRVKITLYPASLPASELYTEGDLPSWILSVRGSETWSLEIPFLHWKPWTTGDDYVNPNVVVSLLEDLPQPFDVPASIDAFVFLASGPDLNFAGLQSCVPQDLDPIVFQCSVIDEMHRNCEHIGNTFDFPYQGGAVMLHDIMRRYSSRDVAAPNIFPFPINISSWEDLWELDNFDYCAQLFMFYTGDTNVKLFFAAGAAGVIRTSISNSSQQLGGRYWKAGNSMAASDQTVWPVLDFKYPYMSEMEFDSVYTPNAMFPQSVSNIDDINEMFICGSDQFRLLYLMPVPDFFIYPPPVMSRTKEFKKKNKIGKIKEVEEVKQKHAPPPQQDEKPKEIVFQAVARYTGNNTIYGRFTTTAGVYATSVDLSGVTVDWSKTTAVKVRAVVISQIQTGTVEGFLQVGAVNTGTMPAANSNTSYSNTPMLTMPFWTAQASNTENNPSVINLKGKFVSSGFSGTSLWIRLNQESVNTSFKVLYSVTVSGWDNVSILATPTSSDTKGLVYVENLPVLGDAIPVFIDPGHLPVDVAIGSSVDITIKTDPLAPPLVDIAGTVGVINAPSTILDVSVVNSVPIDGPVAVVGSVGNTVPVFTSLYKA